MFRPPSVYWLARYSQATPFIVLCEPVKGTIYRRDCVHTGPDDAASLLNAVGKQMQILAKQIEHGSARKFPEGADFMSEKQPYISDNTRANVKENKWLQLKRLVGIWRRNATFGVRSVLRTRGTLKTEG